MTLDPRLVVDGNFHLGTVAGGNSERVMARIDDLVALRVVESQTRRRHRRFYRRPFFGFPHLFYRCFRRHFLFLPPAGGHKFRQQFKRLVRIAVNVQQHGAPSLGVKRAEISVRLCFYQIVESVSLARHGHVRDGVGKHHEAAGPVKPAAQPRILKSSCNPQKTLS